MVTPSLRVTVGMRTASTKLRRMRTMLRMRVMVKLDVANIVAPATTITPINIDCAFEVNSS